MYKREALEGHREIVELLISRNAEVNARDNTSNTPLDLAIRYERLDVADLLRAQGGEIGTIHGVARNGYLASVQAHLDAGVDINARDKNGSTPLHWAARYGQKQVVELLISRNAEVNAKDNSGSTPLDRATQGNHADIADLLRAQGGEIGTIHGVARNGYLSLIHNRR